MFCREAVAWKHLRHPNILPFLGVNLETHKYAMISEWMDNGNINEFIEKHREANRMQLVSIRIVTALLTEIGVIGLFSWWTSHPVWTICTASSSCTET